jgi:hypothetical protein
MVDDLTPTANDTTGADGGDVKAPETLLGTEPQAPAEGQQDPKPEEPKAPVVPESYEDFKLPEGVEINSDMMDKAKAEFKAKGYSQDQAQAAVDLYIAEQTKQVEIFHQTRKEWVNEIKTDKEFGGEKFDQTVTGAQLALRKFDTDGQMLSLLETSGFGDNPGVIKFLARIHAAMGEDQVFDDRNRGKEDKRPLAERLYGKDGMGPETPK